MVLTPHWKSCGILFYDHLVIVLYAWRIFNYYFYFPGVIGQFKLLIWSWCNIGRCYIQRRLYISFQIFQSKRLESIGFLICFYNYLGFLCVFLLCLLFCFLFVEFRCILCSFHLILKIVCQSYWVLCLFYYLNFSFILQTNYS